MSQRIRVLIVDDSSVMRKLLERILSSDPEIEVVATAPDPYVGREKLVALTPDVVTLDIEMPRMDGLTFLGKIMEHVPTRTVIISSLSTERSETALRALELGAIDVIAKPAIDVSQGITGMAPELIARVKNAARAKLCARAPLPAGSATTAAPRRPLASLAKTTHQVLAIASSTGGTEALKAILPYLPADLPGTLIVQHMPPVFTKTYAGHLQRLCPFEVKEAEHGDKLVPGRVLLAPGNFHMELVRIGGYYHVELNQAPPLHGVRPAADIMMKSVAKHAGANAIGLVLTGMGRDGADGLLAMKNAGSYNIAQDEESCVVFGMPKVAIDLGAIDATLSLSRIASRLVEQFRRREAA